jgi:Arc/MetJ-type ribon-helix-helix transcriptional regulator
MDVTFPAELQQFVDLCVDEGFYVDSGEVVRDAVRRLLEEMSSDEFEATTSHLIASSESEDDGGFASLFAALGGLDGDGAVVEATGDALIDLLHLTRERLLSVLERVERDILQNSGDGTTAERLDISAGIGSLESYVTLRIPRSDEPRVWRSQALAAPRGPLLLDDLSYARGDVLEAIAEVNEAQALRLQQLLEGHGAAMRTLAALMRQVSESNAEIAKKLR